MARDQVNKIGHAGKVATRFDFHDALLEDSLAPARAYDCITLRGLNKKVGFNLLFDLVLPHAEVVVRLHRCADGHAADERVRFLP
jgi:hypothetical protein